MDEHDYNLTAEEDAYLNEVLNLFPGSVLLLIEVNWN